ncbi:MAG: DUF2878 domain-containing protein [Gammaproteobacteria bacterium]
MQWILSRPFNIAVFNLVWIGCVVGGNRWLWLVAPLTLAYLATLLLQRKVQVQQIVLPALLGIFVDSVLTLTGIFYFDHSMRVIPLWLVVLWFGFASTLSQSLEIVGSNKWLAAALGALVFPFNYAVGEGLGAVDFQHGYSLALITLGLIWLPGLPLLFLLSQKTVEDANEAT